MLLHKLNYYGLFSGYLNWFLSYLTNRQSCERFSVILLAPFVVLSGVLQGSVLGSLLFNIFINDLCDVINHSNCLLFADGPKVCGAINSPGNYLRLRSDIDRVHEWCSANFIKPKFTKITVICFTRKTKVLYYPYRLGNSLIFRRDCTKDLGVLIGCKLHFHHHADFLCFTCNEIISQLLRIEGVAWSAQQIPTAVKLRLQAAVARSV
jgi:hypothetical protein